MSLFRFYTYRDKLLIPTVYQAQSGFYFDDAPVTVCSITDGEQARIFLQTVLMTVNQCVPTPVATDDPGSAMLEILGLKRWLSFENDATMYTVQTMPRAVHYYSSGQAVDGSWRADVARHVTFPVGAGGSTPESVGTEAGEITVFNDSLLLESVLNSIMNDINRDAERWLLRNQPGGSGTGLMLLPAAPEKSEGIE